MSTMAEVKARTLELNPSLPFGWQEMNYLGHYHYLPGSWSQALSWNSNPGTLKSDTGTLTRVGIVKPNDHSSTDDSRQCAVAVNRPTAPEA